MEPFLSRDKGGWTLDPALDAGSLGVCELELSQARLQRDARFPWLILVPRRTGARELEDLAESDRVLLMAEILAAGRAARAIGEAIGAPVTKLNNGALGNITPQLHVHVVGRRPDDAAWPGPVWGAPGALAYAPAALARALAAARSALFC